MDATTISGIAGVILSLLCSYLPGLKTWYEGLTGEVKSLVMLGLLLLVSAGAFGLSCGGWITAYSCDQAGIKSLIESFISALVANQSTHTITRKLKPQP